MKYIQGDNQSTSPRIVLVTAYRRENFGEPIRNICQALRQLAEHYGDSIRIAYPVHLNPNIQRPTKEILENIPNIILLPPLDYRSLVHIMKLSALVLTDSGGIQEEAPGLGKPVLVLRNVKERPGGVDAGTVRLIGTETAQIVQASRNLLDNDNAYNKMAQAINPYGDDNAAKRIVNKLLVKKNIK